MNAIDRELGVIETKLDILITDFQRSRKEQALVNKETKEHSSKEDEVQAKILTTLKWHTVIGGVYGAALALILLGGAGG